MKIIFKFFLFILFAATLPQAHSEKMSVETHSIVIDKLEIALKTTPRGQGLAIKQRLADLYSERARLKSIEDYKNNCTTCTLANADRKIALSYYEQIFRSQRLNGKLIVQMAQLYSLLGKPHKSVRLYKTVTAKPKLFSKDLLRTANIRLATIEYRKGKYKTALRFLKNALKYPLNYRAGFIKYHIAWSYLNLGENAKAKKALVNLLKNPRFLVTDKSGQIDKAFHKQAALDLAKFYARSPINRNDIQLLFELSPADVRIENLKNLASEVERLGGTSSAIKVWQAYQKLNSNKKSQLESLIHIAQLQLTLGREKSALMSIYKLSHLWNKENCGANCNELRIRYRVLVTGWHKSKKLRPSVRLLNAYGSFNSNFP